MTLQNSKNEKLGWGPSISQEENGCMDSIKQSIIIAVKMDKAQKNKN